MWPTWKLDLTAKRILLSTMAGDTALNIGSDIAVNIG